MQHLKLFLKSMLSVSMLFLFWNTDIFAQEIPIKRSHAISEAQPRLASNLNATGTLNVVAIMVEFQPDSTRFTTGTGIFGEDGMEGLPYLANAEDFRVDPLPHDAGYFEAHLEFAKNYFEKSSDGQLTINYQLLPSIYRLPKKMEEYSPTGETFTNEKIAELARDAWQEVADGANFDATGLDPETTAFVIFHAGVGRDIELVGTSLDITPHDIPSIYMRKDNLGRLLNNPSFNGFPVNDGNFRVTNTLIIPRTESRRGLDIQENEFAFPLSINGLLCASIGSHLGLPDLFNTETGDPAIGRFGLMDGAGFFSYNGLLPPEPSAWEKMYLGWETPFEIDVNTAGDIQLPANSLDQPNAIAKYSLSSSEYFLVENRHRDPDGTGITITIRKPDGTEVQQTFTNQDEAFVFQESDFDTLLQAGTFVNASNFDFSLPGGIDVGENEDDPSDDRELNGGILIWHIDEAVIDMQLQNDRINADPNRRGVDLEEADGAQDIGPGVPGALDNSAAFGSFFDYWWSGNDYHVILTSGQERSFYENRFAPDTRPNNNSNSGAPSFFELYDFSDNLPTASFKIQPAEPEQAIYTPLFSLKNAAYNLFTPEDEYWDYFPLSMGIHEADSDTLLIIPGASVVHIYDHFNPQPGHVRVFGTSSNQQPLLGKNFIISTNPSQAIENQEQLEISSKSLDAQGDPQNDWTVTTAPNHAFLSSQSGDSLFADFTTNGFLIEDGAPFTNPSQFVFTSEQVNGKYVGISGNTATFVGEDIPDYASSSQNRFFAGTIKTDGNPLYYIFEEDAFTLVDPRKTNPFTTIFEEEKAEWPAIVDGLSIYRVNRTQNQIEGFNQNGAVLENAPIPAPADVQFTGTPLIADITGDNIQDILVVGQDEVSMNIYAFETSGQPIEGFPLYVGEVEEKNVQPIHPFFYGNVLYAASHHFDIKAWEFHDFTTAQWPARYGKNPFNKVSGDVILGDSDASTFSVLNGEETYNWPNPAREETNIRFELAAPGGTVEITVITMTGRIIFEETINSSGGLPEEIEINTQNWGSGGYVARVKATVEGKTETKLIKIGVVH